MSRRPPEVPGFWAASNAAWKRREVERARSVERRVLKRAFAGFVAAGRAALGEVRS